MRFLTLALILLAVAPTAMTVIADAPEADETFGDSVAPPGTEQILPIDDGPVAAQPVTLPDGRIAIVGPITIAEPGSYVVTRNITASDTIITITTDNVDLDLNGFTLDTSCDPCVVDTIRATGDDIRIHDGAVRAFRAINDYYGHYAVKMSGRGAVVEDCLLYGGLRVAGSHFRLSGNIIHSPAEGVDGIYAGSTGLIKNNMVHSGGDGRGITVGDHVQIIENEVIGNRSPVIRVGGRCRVASNTVSCSYSPPRQFCLGVLVAGNGNLLLENIVSGALEGIVVEGNYNHIEGNIISSTSFSCMNLEGDENVYRRNTCRGSGEGFFDSGTGNTSHGDNYMPGPM